MGVDHAAAEQDAAIAARDPGRPGRSSAVPATLLVVGATAALSAVHHFGLLGRYGPAGWPEVFAVVLYALSVWLAARKSVWTWWTGIAATALYLYIFWDLALYADAGLQVVFIVFSIWGLLAWSRTGGSDDDTAGIRRTAAAHLAAVLGAILAGTVLIRAFLIEVGGSAPLWDAVLTAASLGALYLLIRKRVESWYLWIAVDAGYVALFTGRGLYLSAGLYAVLLVIAARAAVDWRRALAAGAGAG